MISITKKLIVEEDKTYIFDVYQNYKFTVLSCERKLCAAVKIQNVVVSGVSVQRCSLGRNWLHEACL